MSLPKKAAVASSAIHRGVTGATAGAPNGELRKPVVGTAGTNARLANWFAASADRRDPQPALEWDSKGAGKLLVQALDDAAASLAESGRTRSRQPQGAVVGSSQAADALSMGDVRALLREVQAQQAQQQATLRRIEELLSASAQRGNSEGAVPPSHSDVASSSQGSIVRQTQERKQHGGTDMHMPRTPLPQQSAQAAAVIPEVVVASPEAPRTRQHVQESEDLLAGRHTPGTKVVQAAAPTESEEKRGGAGEVSAPAKRKKPKKEVVDWEAEWEKEDEEAKAAPSRQGALLDEVSKLLESMQQTAKSKDSTAETGKKHKGAKRGRRAKVRAACCCADPPHPRTQTLIRPRSLNACALLPLFAGGQRQRKRARRTTERPDNPNYWRQGR